MLEIPESHTIARQLADTVLGKEILAVQANASPHGFAFYYGDPAAYEGLLLHKSIDAAVPLAGQVELRMGEARLLLGDGVNIRYYAPGAGLPEKHQLYLGFADGSAIVCTVQMYGGMWAFRGGANDSFYYLVAMEKPSPLTDAFTEGYFHGIWQEAKPNLSAKGLLATEQRIPGLGNGTLQDILFSAGVNPQSKVEALSAKDEEALFIHTKGILADMTALGGRDTEKDIFGNAGGYKTILSSKTKDAPCPVCGDAIVRKAYMGGNVYFCPTCQPVKK